MRGKIGSYTKTANMLNTSQSNLTHDITKLEQDINIKLINRTTRSFALTEFGALFSQRCESIVDEVDQLMALVSSYKKEG